MADASVVVVNWNGLSYLPACLDSLRDCGSSVEMIVVDNGSTDGSVDYLNGRADVILVASPINLGYAQANNRGVEQATSDLVLLLNNDTRVAPGFLKPMLQVMRTMPSVGACQSKMLTFDQPPRVDAYGSYLLTTGFLYHLRYGQPDPPPEPPFEIFAAKGAAMLVRVEVLRRVGVFDPDFFAYLEDSDLSWRIWLQGWRILCVPDSIVYHRGGASASRLPSTFITFHSFKNRLCMLLKNLSTGSACWMVPLHLLLNLGLILVELVRGRPGSARSVAAAFAWNVRHWRGTMTKRREVQRRIRTIGDGALFPRITRRVRPSYYYYLLTGLARYHE